MRHSLSLIALLALTSPPLLAAGNISAGKALHEKNCMRCHDNSIYTRKDSIIFSYDGLNKRVRFCEGSNNLAWNEQQIDDVVAYLNTTFYKFKVK